MTGLYWLPEVDDWRTRLRALAGNDGTGWDEAVALANTRLDFVRTNALDQTVSRLFDGIPPPGLATKPVRLALLGSSTLAHLHAAIRVAGLRRGMWVSIYENEYGQYWQELADPHSALHRFQPNTVLFALDAYHLSDGFSANLDRARAERGFTEARERIRDCWSLARDAFRCPLIHQTPLPVHPAVLGGNEHRLPGSRQAFISRLNHELRGLAESDGVDLLALDARAAIDGLDAWHDPALWLRARQEISPAAAPFYGDLVVRLLAAQQGRSSKCLVLDLDDTIWGGVVGDDGLAGLVLGQGSALGEAFLHFQQYARELSRRGVILAVCSKNDEATAFEPFDSHPEMVLRRSDIASFVANWNDKPANIRAIADELNIGLDSLVFVDDNAFERELVRRELPMVAVPEIGDDPAGFARTLADSGYFEAVGVTDEDRGRTGEYQGNRQRERLRASATDVESYLRSLEMVLTWRRFDETGLQRVVQLINKTNQFNLTTRRYGADDIRAIMADSRAFGLQLRLSDRFGDNGIIAIVIGRPEGGEDLLIDTWLMSCRVLGRQVEPATLRIIGETARLLGARRLIGEYLPTKANRMVKDHYSKLGFTYLETRDDGRSRYSLDLPLDLPGLAQPGTLPASALIAVKEG